MHNKQTISLVITFTDCDGYYIYSNQVYDTLKHTIVVCCWQLYIQFFCDMLAS